MGVPVEKLDEIGAIVNVCKPHTKVVQQGMLQLQAPPPAHLARSCKDDCAKLAASIDVALNVLPQIAPDVFIYSGDQDEALAIRQFTDAIHTRVIATVHRSELRVVRASEKLDRAALEQFAVERLSNRTIDRVVESVWHYEVV
ncbi:MAG: hypothetical protein ACM3S1_04845 [Hyphomicrobiales bacterium]